MGSIDSISNLPPELLFRICDFIDTKQSLLNFSLSSRQFYGIARTGLYAHIDLLSDADERFARPGYLSQAERALESLTVAFIRKPDVARLVRHLHLRLPADMRARTWLDAPLKLPPEIERLFRNLGASVDPSAAKPEWPESESDESDLPVEGGEWSEFDDIDLADSTPEEAFKDHFGESREWVKMTKTTCIYRARAYLAVLLAFLPRLESADIEVPWQPQGTDVIDEVLACAKHFPRAPGDPLPLENLTSLCYGSDSKGARAFLPTSLATLPNLKAIYLHRVLGVLSSEPWATPHSLALEHIEMRDCHVEPRELRLWLRLPRALKTFIYEIGEARGPTERDMALSYRSVRTALLAQRRTLQRIWIDYPHVYQFEDSSDELTLPMGSFANFPALVDLHIASTYLFGFIMTSNMDPGRLVRALPDQIEHLHLSHADEDEETPDGVRRLLHAVQRGRFPRLKTLHLDTTNMYFILNTVELLELFGIAWRLGVRLRFFDNLSERRAYHSSHGRARMAEQLKPCDELYEMRWGFDGEAEWPERQTGCMKRPTYKEIRHFHPDWYLES